MHLSLCPLLTIIVQQESSIPWKSSPPGKQWKTKSSWIYKVTRQKPGEKTQQNYKENICKFTVWAVVDLSAELLISQKTSPPPLFLSSEITSGLITPVISNQCCLHLVTWCPATPHHPLSIYSTFPQTWFKMKFKLNYFITFSSFLCCTLLWLNHSITFEHSTTYGGTSLCASFSLCIVTFRFINRSSVTWTKARLSVRQSLIFFLIPYID